ncbi:MAG TPA: YceI family protein [Rhodocyclaceae bacterium]|nr:YceI family protein [Rhodocyclaceae bacterium]
MKKFLASIALAAAAAAPVASALAADTYTIDPNHTFPIFEVSHLGFSVQHGRFNKTSGTVTLDTAAKKGSVDLTIDVASLDMGFPLWDQHMADEGFFNTAKFPTMSFKSNKLIFDGDKVVGAEGEFTMLGVTKPLKLSVSNFKCGANPMNKKDMCGAEISATLKRSDFGMTKYVPVVGDEIKITSPVEAYKQ